MHEGPHITRLRFVIILMGFFWLILWGRVGIIQGLRHKHYNHLAVKQRVKPVTLTANRGCILDRNGVQLAVNLSSASYGIRPEEITDVEGTALALCAATGMSPESILPVLTSDKSFLWLIRQPDISVIRELDREHIIGLHKIDKFRRYYPLGKIGAQMIGYTDVDGRGIEGCELYADNELSGRNGSSVEYIDAFGRAGQSLDRPDVEPQDGLDVLLTIDWRIQEIADEALEEGVEAMNALWGGAIVLDPGTGEILAMSNVPGFDPNDPVSFNPETFDPGIRRNRIVTDMLEPGSTFKIVTFIEALESGILHEDDLVDCENGKFKIGRHTIHDTHKLKIVPSREAFIQSSNIGAVKIADKIGKQKLYKRARLLGFGSVTGIDVPDESKGLLPHPGTWSKLSLPTISFGHGVAVSPIQLAMSYAAVANGGFLLRPHIIKEVISNGNRSGHRVEKQVIRSAMSAGTAKRIEELLCKVVESGTGRKAALPNIRIAGKTGTAQRVREGKKGYEKGRYISSFIGYVTDFDPKILCLVLIDSPEGQYYGSQVAAPVFKKIVNRMLNMGSGPWSHTIAEKGENTGEISIALPNVKGVSIHDAVTVLHRLGLKPSVMGDSTMVVRQSPPAGVRLNEGDSVTLYSNIMTVESGNRVRIPELRGKTVREAIQHLVQAQLKVNVSGSGIVSKQNPPAGSLVEHGTVCMLVCSKK